MRCSNWIVIAVLSLLSGCASTEIIESPKTAYVSERTEVHTPRLFWTSKGVSQNYGYLGVIKVRSWTYEGAVHRLEAAAGEMKADALIDIHYEAVGFFSSLHAFAIQFK